MQAERECLGSEWGEMLDQAPPLAALHVVARKPGQIAPPLHGAWHLAPSILVTSPLASSVHVDADTRQKLLPRLRRP